MMRLCDSVMLAEVRGFVARGGGRFAFRLELSLCLTHDNNYVYTAARNQFPPIILI